MKDPFFGLNEHIQNQARRQIPAYYVIGKVLSLSPLTIRAAGLDLDGADLKIAAHLRPDQSWGVSLYAAELEEPGEFEKVHITPVDPLEVGASGKLSGSVHLRLPPMLEKGDEVLLIPSTDGQTYYLVDRMVRL